MTTPSIRVPFSRATTAHSARQRIEESLSTGLLAGDGPATERCRLYLEKVTGCERALMTPSCTHALEMIAIQLGLEPGDEVVVPSFTFVSSANAFATHGAVPRFCDVRSDTLNINERDLERHITDRTRAIVVVHYGGVAAEMDAVMKIAAQHDLVVIEDAAHALFGSYRGRPLGGIGEFGTLSFHESKNLTCGEGGALLINRPDLVERAEIIREKGTDRSRFFRGFVDKYTWTDYGSSYLLADLLAAALSAQFDEAERIQTARHRIWARYADGLGRWAAEYSVQLPRIPPGCDHTAHVFFLLAPDPETRTRLLDHLKARGILAVFHYLPLHLSAMGERFGGRPGDCPVSESVAERIVRLPLYTDMTEAEQDEVIEAVLEFSP
jgi:dTDP-4-amino-4,6-dideoxygalactose transaminase